MSLDFTRDFSNSNLLSNKNVYTDIYKLDLVESQSINCGDKLLLKFTDGSYSLFIATSAPDEDGTLHLSKLTEFDFVKNTGVNTNHSSNTQCNPNNCSTDCGC